MPLKNYFKFLKDFFMTTRHELFKNRHDIKNFFEVKDNENALWRVISLYFSEVEGDENPD